MEVFMALSLTSSMVMQNSRNEVFETMERNFQTLYGQWQTEYQELEKFKADVNIRSHNLQHEKTANPGKEALETERDDFSKKYWEFYTTVKKIETCIDDLSKIITMYSPKERNYSDEKKLQSEQPERYEKFLTEQDLNKRCFSELQGFSNQAASLKEKYVATLKSQLPSLQRFCQIVDNGGKPIHWSTRASNNVRNLLWTPAIPKPEAKKDSLTSSVPPATPTINSQASAAAQTTSQPQQQVVSSASSNAAQTTSQPQMEASKETSCKTSPTSQPQPQAVKTESSTQSQPNPAQKDGEKEVPNTMHNMTAYEKTADSNKPTNPQGETGSPNKRNSTKQHPKS